MGLDSPRHLAFGSRGDLFVAEAGRGGSGPCFVGGEGPACMGATGAVTKIGRWGRQSRIVEGWPPTPTRRATTTASAPAGITVLGANAVFVTNGGPDGAHATTPGAPISRDTLAEQNPGRGSVRPAAADQAPRAACAEVADLWAFERDVNPDAEVGNPRGRLQPRRRAGSTAAASWWPTQAGTRWCDVVEPTAVAKLARVPQPPGAEPVRRTGHPDAGRAHRRRAGRIGAVLRQPAHRLPVPARRCQRLPR